MIESEFEICQSLIKFDSFGFLGSAYVMSQALANYISTVTGSGLDICTIADHIWIYLDES
jgi:hypothetical protein